MSLVKISVFVVLFSFIVVFSGCSPEVGSDEWCQNMKEKPKKDWTAAEAAEYTKSCIFK